VRQDEAVEHHLLALDFGLPTEQLVQPLRAVMSGSSTQERVVLEAINRRGRAIACTTTIRPLRNARDDEGAPFGAIVVMEDATSADGTDDAAEAVAGT
jgi:two-component system CheB/CheR fusion protein